MVREVLLGKESVFRDRVPVDVHVLQQQVKLIFFTGRCHRGEDRHKQSVSIRTQQQKQMQYTLTLTQGFHLFLIVASCQLFCKFSKTNFYYYTIRFRLTFPSYYFLRVLFTVFASSTYLQLGLFLSFNQSASKLLANLTGLLHL